ncbi:MAG: hypothetical protein K2K57_09195 [Oscillospiraceae bacterium]|nr:hypothetical protein [Oscillospiraceae bacterium]
MNYVLRTVLNGLGKDEVYIPRQVMCREDISDNAKLIYGMIFSECLSKMENIDEQTVNQAAKVISDFCKDVPMTTIERECMSCGDEAIRIHEELYSLSSKSDTAVFLNECKSYFIRMQKPVCNFCSSGRMMYKAFDLINNLVCRMLDDTYVSEMFSDEEIEILNEYNKNHNVELLDDVIDILKE